jgi:hypothetical protein
MDVGITPMPLSCVSFSFYFGEKNDSCNDKNKTMDLHMSSNFASTSTMVTSFDLWMSKGVMNTFALAINYLNEFWTSMHETTKLSMIG